jgi:hypothetical protein
MQKVTLAFLKLCLETKEGISFYQIDELKWPPNKIHSQCHTKKNRQNIFVQKKQDFECSSSFLVQSFFCICRLGFNVITAKAGKLVVVVIVVAPKDNKSLKI